MTRKTKPENETVLSSDAAAPRPRRQTAGSRARRASSPAATPVPPAAVDAVVTPDSTSSGAAPKPRRKQPAPRTTRTQVKAEPSREAIAELAYRYWQSRGDRHGSAVEDWLRAERELQQRTSKVTQ
jgi:hypothetical protein